MFYDFDVAEIFLLELKGRGGGGDRMRGPLCCFKGKAIGHEDSLLYCMMVKQTDSCYSLNKFPLTPFYD
jgi:hypothetical protein